MTKSDTLAPLAQSSTAVQRLLYKQTETQAARLGSAVATLSDTVREVTSRVQEQQPLVPLQSLANTLTGTLDRASEYLSTTGGEQFLQDIERFGRARPALAASVALAAGFTGARLFKVASLRENES